MKLFSYLIKKGLYTDTSNCFSCVSLSCSVMRSYHSEIFVLMKLLLKINYTILLKIFNGSWGGRGGAGRQVVYLVYFVIVLRSLSETAQNLSLVDCTFIATEYIFKRGPPPQPKPPTYINLFTEFVYILNRSHLKYGV